LDDMGKKNFSGMKVLVMGLGLNGGGFESARYLALAGADVSVTDLRDERALAPSIEKLEAALGGVPVRYILGRHNTEDFEKADMVVKNPGVRPDSPYLKAARNIETDISLFLAASPARLTAVTGSKGKSSTASALHWVLNGACRTPETRLTGAVYLGGNITVSPLSFLDELGESDEVVLELSSWQLGDLKGRVREDGSPLLKPGAAVITAIMPDHLDRYKTMEAYVADKRIIYRGQDGKDLTVAENDEWGRSFHAESRGRPLTYSETPLRETVPGGWLTGKDGPGLVRLWDIPGGRSNTGALVEAVPSRPLVPGYHQKKNLLAAALALLDRGLPPDFVRERLGTFAGIEHRLEFFYQAEGIRWYNDSSATIPEAAAAAVAAFDHAPVLVCGGTDKNLEFGPLVKAAAGAKTVILLAGTGSEKLKPLLERAGIPYCGPFDSADAAVKAAREAASPGDVVVFSPGCTSFGMFLNEFDRGRKWKEAVRGLA
jgi:UDP-N-acetylmuramoylalanine--D-glutamate ligase